MGLFQMIFKIIVMNLFIQTCNLIQFRSISSSSLYGACMITQSYKYVPITLNHLYKYAATFTIQKMVKYYKKIF